jgi:O-antigen/teichoic acid export membrane protein
MIDRFSTKENVGFYSLASNLSMVIVVIYGSILNAWTPSYYEAMATKNYEKLNSDVEKISQLSALAASVIILLCGELARIVFPASYHEGLFIVPILVFGYFLDLGWQLYGRHFGYAKKTYYITIIGMIVSLLNLIANSHLIPIYGYFYAAITTVFSYGLMLILSIIATKFFIKLYPYPIKIMYGPTLLVAIASGLSIFAELYCESMFRILFKLLILFLISLFAFKVVKKREYFLKNNK